MGTRWHNRLARVGAAALCLPLLVACGDPPVPEALPPDPLPSAETCCVPAEPYPDWLIAVAEAEIDLVRRIGLIELRPGFLSDQPEATAVILQALRPLDVVFLHSEGRVSGHLIPGHFTHGAIYLGTEDQLRSAGLWSRPALDGWRDRIAAGASFIEAVDGGVRLIGPEVVLNTDAAVLLRRRGLGRTARAAALGRAMDQIGVPFDMAFDIADHSRLFCAEFIELVFPGGGFPHRTVYGRESLLIDAIVAGALDGSLPFDLVGYVEASGRGGARAETAEVLAWRLRSAWPAAGVSATASGFSRRGLTLAGQGDN